MIARPPPSPGAFVLDLDGTLIDSRGDIAAACNVTLAAFSRSPLPIESIVTMIGDGSRVLLARAFDVPNDDPILDDALAVFLASYAKNPVVHTKLLPGAHEIMTMGLPFAIVTNKARAITMLIFEALGLTDRLFVVRGGDEGKLKPDPEGVLAVLAQLGAPPSTTWMIGDGPQDILAGRAAGTFTVGVPGIAHRDQLLAAKPDLVLESLHDVVLTARRA